MNLARWLERRRLRALARAPLDVPVAFAGRTLLFRCQTETELWRARTAATKEAGTVEWIAGTVKPGEVFCDIGANIGLYTLMAAAVVGERGRVYAFEPHAANFLSLMRNIVLNRMEQVVQPAACALHDRDGVFDFNYENLGAGSSMSQLAATRDGEEREFRPVVREAKLATSLDRIIESGSLQPPHHVKLDVDGNELLILRGMQRLLGGPMRPRTLQVEINQRYRAELLSFMDQCGYVQYHRHDTAHGLEQIAQGRPAADVAHNALFRPQ
jgi:FkbM family methyltransferase